MGQPGVFFSGYDGVSAESSLELVAALLWQPGDWGGFQEAAFKGPRN